MPGGWQIEGATSTTVLEVDAQHNLKATLPQTDANVGGLAIASQEGGPTVIRYPKTSEDSRLTVGVCNPRFDFNFNQTALDTARWKCQSSSMNAASNSTGFVVFNNNSTPTSNASTGLQTTEYFWLVGNGGVECSFTGNFTNNPSANQIFEAGLFTISTIPVQPSDGVWFQFSSAGICGALGFGGLINYTPIFKITNAQLVNGQNYRFSIVVDLDVTEFWLENTLLGTIVTPLGNSRPFMQTSLPFGMQQRNAGIVTGSGVMQTKICEVSVDLADTNIGRNYQTFAALNGMMGSQGAPGGTMGSTALYTNSLAPGAGAVPSNTAAVITGLGGQAVVQPTLAGTDGILCSYQVPTGSVNQEPRSLFVTGVRLQSFINSAITLVTGTQMQFAYSIAYGHTAISMATAEATSFQNFNASTAGKAPRRIPLGFETYAALTAGTAPISAGGALPPSFPGAAPGGIYMGFAAPIVVNPGEFIAICVRSDSSVSSAGTIFYTITFDSYWR